MSQPRKTLIFVRHAHRDFINRKSDNGLSEEGKRQARELCQELKKFVADSAPHFISSPKVRCVETLQPLAKLSQGTVETDPRLMEQAPEESPIHFRKRVVAFLKEWYRNDQGLTILCSHGDWLSCAVRLATGARGEFKKGSWAEISVRDKKPVLKFRCRTLS